MPTTTSSRRTKRTTPTTDAAAARPEPTLPGRYALLALAQIIPNPANPRDDATALAPIVENLQEDGIAGLLSPLTVRPCTADESTAVRERLGTDVEVFMIVDGEQRYWSAIEADQTHVPAIIRDDLTDSTEQIISMLRQVHRKDLTAIQLARGIEQLALAGMGDDEIARRTGYTVPQVAAGRSVTSLDAQRVARAQASGLNLTQLAVVAEFATDDGVVGELLEAAEDGPFAFDRATEEARTARELRRRCDERRRELAAAGVVVLAERPTYNDPTAEEITYLRGPDGSPITAQAHGTCPGHAVHLTAQRWSASVAETAYCTDWRAHGHAKATASGSTRRGPMTDAEKQERRLVIANNSAMDAANTVRRKYVAGLLAATTPPKRTEKFIAEMLATGGHVLAIWISGGRPMLNQLLSTGGKRAGTSPVPARAGNGRYTVISLACIAAALESQITRTSWRHPDRVTAAWLAFLTANGFQPGAVEQLITNAKADKPASRKPADAKAAEPDPETADLAAA